MGNPHFYDGRLALVFWAPKSVNETSIAQLADTLRARAPNISAVYIKTNNGAGWQGAHDSSKPNLAINSIADVRRWVDTLATRGLECHAWGVARGNQPQAEIERVAGICLEGGVKSYLIDLEPGTSYWVGDQDAARAVATGIRERIGPEYHLGLIFDYRGARPQQLWIPGIWFPEIDSLHPMVYHFHFGVSAPSALQSCYAAVGHWGKPIYPMLQGYSPGGSIGVYPASDIPVTAGLAVNQFRATGLSWYRYGKGLAIPDEGLGEADLADLAKVGLPASPPPSAPPPPVVVVSRPPAPPDAPATLVVADPSNERTGEFAVNYYGDASALSQQWSVGMDGNGRPYAFRPATYNAQTLYVSYTPRLIGRGRYAVEAFIPRNNAYIRDAHYFVVDYPEGQRRETTVVLDQSPYYDQWVPLQGRIINGISGDTVVSEFDLDPLRADAGRVNVADVTFIDPATHPSRKFEIAFGALRWRPVPVSAPPLLSLDPPIGTLAERAGPIATGRRTPGGYLFWVGDWFDVNPIGSRYWLSNGWAIHTGADLNLDGSVMADKDAPVYAIGDGVVIWARWVSSGWKNIIVIEHPVPRENRVVWARYAHVASMQVQEGQAVARGQPICTIGEYAPNNYHLHFDIATDPILKTRPGHWPGDNLTEVRRVYTDPLAFLQKYHLVR